MAENSTPLHYPHGLAKAFNEGRAWRYVSFVVSGIALILVMALVYVATHEPVTLVPYGMSLAKGPVKVHPGGDENGPYLAYVAQADLGLALNWTPNTVKAQLERFLNRLTPAAYAKEQASLLAAAKLDRQNDITEAFYPHRVQYAGNTVQVEGLLVRYAGSVQMTSKPVTYSLTYTFLQGKPYVSVLEKAK
jgi:hypothetical protein